MVGREGPACVCLAADLPTRPGQVIVRPLSRGIDQAKLNPYVLFGWYYGVVRSVLRPMVRCTHGDPC